MGIVNWLRNKIFSDDTLDSLSDKMESRAKNIILNALQDEEIAFAVNQYTTALGDFLFERYKGKLYSSLGGIQKGVNASLGSAQGDNSLISSIMDGDGNIDVTRIFANAVLGGLGKGPKKETFYSGGKAGKIGLEHG